jgi:hypothetical protein
VIICGVIGGLLGLRWVPVAEVGGELVGGDETAVVGAVECARVLLTGGGGAVVVELVDRLATA